MSRAHNLRSLVVALALAAGCSDTNDPGTPTPDGGVAGVENFASLTTATLGAGAVPRLGATGPLDAAGASARALEIVAGSVTKVEADTERGLAVWEVKVRTASGGLVELKIVQENGAVLEMEGETGPFDYDVTPGAPLVSLAAARAAAEAAQPGTLKQWELELEENNRWEYEFYIVTAGATVYEVEVDAEAGTVISRRIRGGMGENDDGDAHDDDDDVPDLGPLPDAVRAAALAVVPGSTFIEAEVERENGVIVWEVKVLASGAEIRVYIVPETLAIWELQSKEPPYAGDLDPGLGLVTLQAARATAVTASGQPASQLERWQLQRDESNARWQWRFRFGGADDVRVRVDAATGDVARLDD